MNFVFKNKSHILKTAVSTSNVKRFSVISENLRSKFSKFEGGNVSLLKDNSNGIAEICFQHNNRKNAFSGKMMVELTDIVSELQCWKEGKSVILHSPGTVFCSGADLSMVKQICTSSEGLEMASIMHEALTKLHNLPLISVALLKGKAIGGGAELATSCDFRLLTPEAEVQFVQIKMGVVTGWGGGTRLSHLLNSSEALKLLVSGCKISAEECLQIGLATDILKSNDPLNEAKKWLIDRTKGSSEVVQCAKKIIVNSRLLSYEQSLAQERQLFSSVWGGKSQLDVLNRLSKK